MPFSFTFKLAVPGLSNPFLPTQSLPSAQVEPPNVGPLWVPRDKVARRHLTSEIDLPPSAPLSRKRGWVPSSPEPSQSAATFTSTSGYLDTPAKYREMAAAGGHSEREAEMSGGEFPPPLAFGFGDGTCGWFMRYMCNARVISRSKLLGSFFNMNPHHQPFLSS
jgi:hypothetical protein